MSSDEREVPSVNGVSSDGAWFSASGEIDGKPTLIRAREDLLPLNPGHGLNLRVMIQWTCRAPLDLGVPSPEDYEEIEAFEELITNFLEHGAVLAFVFTHDGVVEYSFYTSDAQWFGERLNEALADKPLVPIELALEEDPDWAEYRALLRGVGLIAE